MNTMMILDEINGFIHNQGEELSLEQMIPVGTIEELFEAQGYEMEDLGDNTNSWSIDFWYWFSHKKDPTKARYCLSGSLWYGNFKIYQDAKENL